MQLRNLPFSPLSSVLYRFSIPSLGFPSFSIPSLPSFGFSSFSLGPIQPLLGFPAPPAFSPQIGDPYCLNSNTHTKDLVSGLGCRRNGTANTHKASHYKKGSKPHRGATQSDFHHLHIKFFRYKVQTDNDGCHRHSFFCNFAKTILAKLF